MTHYMIVINPSHIVFMILKNFSFIFWSFIIWLYSMFVPILLLGVVQSAVGLCVVEQWVKVTLQTVDSSLYSNHHNNSNSICKSSRYIYYSCYGDSYQIMEGAYLLTQQPLVGLHSFYTLHSVVSGSQYDKGTYSVHSTVAAH